MTVDALHKTTCRLKADARDTDFVCRALLYPLHRFAGDGRIEISKPLDVHRASARQIVCYDIRQLHQHGLGVAHLQGTDKSQPLGQFVIAHRFRLKHF